MKEYENNGATSNDNPENNIHCWYTTVKRSDKWDGQNLQVFPEKRRVVMSRSLVFAEWKLGTDFHWCPIENKKIKNKNCIFFH